MKITPLRDRVVVKKDELEEKIEGTALYMPETVDRKQQKGTVISVGPGLPTPHGHVIKTVVQINDRVLFPKHSGVDLSLLEKGLFILPESDILAIIEE